MSACTNVFHDNIDCLSSDLERDDWCDPCKRVEVETYSCGGCGREASYIDEHGKASCDECIAREDRGDFLYQRMHDK